LHDLGVGLAIDLDDVRVPGDRGLDCNGYTGRYVGVCDRKITTVEFALDDFFLVSWRISKDRDGHR
jgi:hypothetical protein